jgi:2-keto-4-pentenoate hydratase
LSKPDSTLAPASALAPLADRQWRNYRARDPGTCFADPDFTLDLQEAYELQGAVSALRIADGDRVVGYKVGCTGPGTIAQFGMAGPIRAYLYESEVRRTGVTLDLADFTQLAIEGEMAIRIGEDGKIAAAFPVIELHHFVFRGPRKTLVELVANNGLNAGIVLPAEGWSSSLAHLAGSPMLRVEIGSRVVESGDLWPMAGGAAASVDWLRQHLAEFGLALAPGQIVLSGTPLGLYPMVPGDSVIVFFDNEPAVRCSIV